MYKKKFNVKFRKNSYVNDRIVFEAIQAPIKFNGELNWDNAPEIGRCKILDWLKIIPNWKHLQIKNIKVSFEILG